MAAERRAMWEARVRRKDRSATVGGTGEGWRAAKTVSAEDKVAEVSLRGGLVFLIFFFSFLRSEELDQGWGRTAYASMRDRVSVSSE